MGRGPLTQAGRVREGRLPRERDMQVRVLVLQYVKLAVFFKNQNCQEFKICTDKSEMWAAISHPHVECAQTSLGQL